MLAIIAFGGPDSPCVRATTPHQRKLDAGFVALPQMALRRVAMPCVLPTPALLAQTPAKHPALRLSGTKNHHFATAPFP
ncbi:hypothetical protein [Methylicorpusculum sp.]|uniref:hypothetical protein n=1 Tax=Methylicorpusculum sp. TaxID=2713644 RepID=UPI002719C5B5|nr:hypothetical protein [Methylicorpusculum sp.]MDO9240210.1 hypothetical protein [Methylicorpusculum sp.]MDP2177095.1 hypothetical protein [Methylicorpusculum sp.]MDP3529324.1 hypothetical protein [Methylicorpusculum sp.]MDZ4152157.1 hypothetical protein [Methylicorpusculum sp.]